MNVNNAVVTVKITNGRKIARRLKRTSKAIKTLVDNDVLKPDSPVIDQIIEAGKAMAMRTIKVKCGKVELRRDN